MYLNSYYDEGHLPVVVVKVAFSTRRGLMDYITGILYNLLMILALLWTGLGLLKLFLLQYIFMVLTYTGSRIRIKRIWLSILPEPGKLMFLSLVGPENSVPVSLSYGPYHLIKNVEMYAP